MKNIIKSFIFIALLISSNACEDFLTADSFSQVSSINFWKTNEDLSAGLAATYDALQNATDNRHWDWGEARSDNWMIPGKPYSDNVDLLSNNLNNSSPSANWQDLYQTISSANYVIHYGIKIAGADPEIVGQAYAIRAYCYFNIVRIWGDAPMWTEAVLTLDQDLELPQTPAATLLSDVIVPDLEKAKTMIKATAGNVTFTKGAVLALDAHVQAWMHNYQNSIDAIQALQNLNRYSLVTTRTDWVKLFVAADGVVDGSGPELIFSYGYNVGTDAYSQLHSILNDGSVNYIMSEQLSTKWLAAYPTLDWRLPESANYTEVTEGDASMNRVCYKYKKITGNDAGRTDCFIDIPVYRYADMVLLKAEMYAKLPNRALAISSLNEIRTARQLPTVTEGDAEIAGNMLLDRILDERQFELFAEGERWFDIRRNNIVVQTMSYFFYGAALAWPDDSRATWPVSLAALDRNSKLIQNPAYDN